MCSTTATGIGKSAGSGAITDFSPCGPPVETPTTKTLYLFWNAAVEIASRAGWACDSSRIEAPDAAITFATNSSATSKTFSVASAVGFCTKSIAPASRPLSTRSLDSPAMLTMTIGRRRRDI
jgi:hypothetical protein